MWSVYTFLNSVIVVKVAELTDVLVTFLMVEGGYVKDFVNLGKVMDNIFFSKLSSRKQIREICYGKKMELIVNLFVIYLSGKEKGEIVHSVHADD